jgi:hypothetical protein
MAPSPPCARSVIDAGATLGRSAVIPLVMIRQLRTPYRIVHFDVAADLSCSPTRRVLTRFAPTVVHKPVFRWSMSSALAPAISASIRWKPGSACAHGPAMIGAG